MKYWVNPSFYSDAFVIPNAVVKQHIKLVGAAQLKVLLWVFANGGKCEDTNDISKDIGLPSAEIVDAMQYWIVNGIINSDENESVDKQNSAEVKKETKSNNTKLPKTKLTSQKPNRAEVAQRVSESDDVKWLLDEAASRFARPLSFPEMSSFVWAHDSLGMPSEVLLMIIQYCFSIDKCNIRYIEKLVCNWIENDIDTVDKAEAHLKSLEKGRKNWSTVSRLFGMEKRLASEKEQAFIDRWINEWRFSSKMIKCAYDTCVDSTGKISFPYINKVLEKWFNNGVKTPDDLKSFVDGGKSGKKKQTDNNKSYDISEINNILVNGGNE